MHCTASLSNCIIYSIKEINTTLQCCEYRLIIFCIQISLNQKLQPSDESATNEWMQWYQQIFCGISTSWSQDNRPILHSDITKEKLKYDHSIQKKNRWNHTADDGLIFREELTISQSEWQHQLSLTNTNSSCLHISYSLLSDQQGTHGRTQTGDE